MVKKIVGTMIAIVMLNGCYTQFSTLEEKNPPPPPQISYEIDSATGDTVKVIRSVDTMMVKQNQNCYWTRDFLGQPELRCDNSMYGHDWYTYNDYPWWYRSDPYYYDYSGRCPRYYYYDASCGCCQYWGGGGFRDDDRWGGGGGVSTQSGNGKARRTSSSSVPSRQGIQIRQGVNKTISTSDVRNQGKMDVMESRRLQAKTAADAAAKDAGNVNQTPPPDTRTRVQPAEIPAETSQPPSPAVQQTPNPPSGNSNPPPSNGGGSGNNDGNRRNPRSW
jgi:hypothetical protein